MFNVILIFSYIWSIELVRILDFKYILLLLLLLLYQHKLNIIQFFASVTDQPYLMVDIHVLQGF